MSVAPFKRVVVPGDVDVGWEGRPRVVKLWIEIHWQERNGGMELSISGVEGPKRNGDAWGSCGQVRGSLDEIVTPSPGWTRPMIATLSEIWERWHLNRMRAGCEHQRAAGWDQRPIDPDKPLNAYGKHFEGQRSGSWNMLTWVRPDEHPDGLLTKPCDVCGYRYGSSWLAEEVPDEPIAWLRDLPRGTHAEYPWSLS